MAKSPHHRKRKSEHDSGYFDSEQERKLKLGQGPDRRQVDFADEQRRYEDGTHPSENPLYDDTRG